MRHDSTRKPFIILLAAAAVALLCTLPSQGAFAGGSGGLEHGTMPGGTCSTGITVVKPISIYKPVTINKNVNITNNIDASKNINITKNIDVSKNISIYKPVTIVKTIDASKNISINKTIVINKGGSGSAMASAMAQAFAQAMASANAQATVNVSGGGGGNVTYYANSYSETQVVNRNEGEIGGSAGGQPAPRCQMQYASVIKSIHAVCVAANGQEFPASHMTPETWIDSSYEGEVARCIPGAHLKITIGEVSQSDQGMAASYERGLTLVCGLHQALRHYKDGVVKCAPEIPVPDCTERTNLRRYGTGDMFFTFRAQVCLAAPAEEAGITLQGMSLTGGVGD